MQEHNIPRARGKKGAVQTKGKRKIYRTGKISHISQKCSQADKI